MYRRKDPRIRSWEITPETVYLNRRRLLRVGLGAGLGLGALMASGGVAAVAQKSSDSPSGTVDAAARKGVD